MMRPVTARYHGVALMHSSLTTAMTRSLETVLVTFVFNMVIASFWLLWHLRWLVHAALSDQAFSPSARVPYEKMMIYCRVAKGCQKTNEPQVAPSGL